MNFTLLSPGMICLLQPLHTGSEIFGEFESKSNIFEDIMKSTLLGIYTFLETQALLCTSLLISPPNNACIVLKVPFIPSNLRIELVCKSKSSLF